MDVADGAEFVGVVGGAVVDDGEFKLGFGGVVTLRPFLKMAGELGVGDDIDAVNAADGREVVEHVLNHRLARDGQERFGLREGEWIQARGVSGGKDDDFHNLIQFKRSTMYKLLSGYTCKCATVCVARPNLCRRPFLEMNGGRFLQT